MVIYHLSYFLIEVFSTRADILRKGCSQKERVRLCRKVLLRRFCLFRHRLSFSKQGFFYLDCFAAFLRRLG